MGGQDKIEKGGGHQQSNKNRINSFIRKAKNGERWRREGKRINEQVWNVKSNQQEKKVVITDNKFEALADNGEDYGAQETNQIQIKEKETK